jgi:hypothetical protein
VLIQQKGYGADEVGPILERAKELAEQVGDPAAERTVDGLWSAIGRLLDRFSPRECRNYFRHCGYRRHATRS